MNENAVIQSTNGNITFADITNSFKEIGISSGDTLFIHSCLFSFGRPVGECTKEGFANIFIEAILSVIGSEGTLIVPTFTLSFCKTGFFDSIHSKSEVGLLSEVFRQRNNIVRSSHPIYSVAVMGKDKDYYLSACTTNCSGVGSLFDLIHQKSTVKIMLLGLEVPATTQFHYVEEQAKVPYRHIKNFTGTVDGKPAAVDVYVRNRQVVPTPQIDQSKFRSFFEEHKHLLKKTTLGDGTVMVIEEKDMHQLLWKKMKEDPNYFLNEPYPRAVNSSQQIEGYIYEEINRNSSVIIQPREAPPS